MTDANERMKALVEGLRYLHISDSDIDTFLHAGIYPSSDSAFRRDGFIRIESAHVWAQNNYSDSTIDQKQFNPNVDIKSLLIPATISLKFTSDSFPCTLEKTHLSITVYFVLKKRTVFDVKGNVHHLPSQLENVGPVVCNVPKFPLSRLNNYLGVLIGIKPFKDQFCVWWNRDNLGQPGAQSLTFVLDENEARKHPIPF